MCDDVAGTRKKQLLEDIRVFEALLEDLSELPDEERAWGVWALTREIEIKRGQLVTFDDANC